MNLGLFQKIFFLKFTVFFWKKSFWNFTFIIENVCKYKPRFEQHASM